MKFFKFGKRSKAEEGEPQDAPEAEAISAQDLSDGLSKTRRSFSDGLWGLFRTSNPIDDSLFDEMEDHLIMSDLGATTAMSIVGQLREEADKMKYSTADQLQEALKRSLVDILTVEEKENDLNKQPPYVVLMVGVNGVGKTTTLAKIAKKYKDAGAEVMMAACDTFRAAAIEQLITWGERLDIPVVAQQHGADPAAVAFDAYSAAAARGVDILLIDTAGRQHTQGDLMEQLKKVVRVLKKANADLPHQTLLTVDAGNGQNILSQLENFQKAADVDGLCVTKLDGTAKGGIVVSVVEKFNIPVRYIGVGEKVEDLKPFEAEVFVEALLPDSKSDG